MPQIFGINKMKLLNAKKIPYELTEDGSSEFQQAVIRVVILSIIFVYFVTRAYLEGSSSVASEPMVILVGVFFAGSLLNILSFRFIPGKCITRRVITLLVDLSVLSYGLHIGGSSATVCFSIYLWLLVGYGLRYGQNYLFAGTLIGSVEFFYVLQHTDYWIEQKTAGYGLLVGIIALPIFFSSLLRKLTKARAVAEEANKSKSQFLANMSHEIRTPLNGVIGMSELLNSTKLSNEQKELTNTINTSAHALLSIIEDVLDISKIEAGKFTIEKTDFDLHHLISSTAKMMRVQSDAKGLDLNTYISPSTPFSLIGDPHHLRQVFINLIGNAIKFTDSGGIQFTTTTVNESHNSVRVRFEVVDSGIGIPLERQASIFESFTQADSSTTRKYGGTGLGTTISKEIISQMGGEIGLHSTPGSGSTFWIEVPFNKQSAQQDLDDASVFAGLTGLVISDEKQSKIIEALSSWGIQHHSEPNYSEALHYVSSLPTDTVFALVIIDATRSGDSNNDNILLSDKTLRKIPAIRVSGTTDNPNQHVQAKRYSSTITLPLDHSALYNALHATQSYIDGASSTKNEKSLEALANESAERNILVAEDNPTNQLVISKILEHAGHTYSLCSNGREALDLLEARDFDLIIMDMQMPEMGGIEAAKIYNFSTSNNRRSPIIILTANATVEAQRECKDANIDAYLTKPVVAAELLSTINHLCASGLPGDSSAESQVTELASNNHDDSTHKCVDTNVLESINNLSADNLFLSQLIATFINDANSLLKKMEASIADHDIAGYLEHVHALKGSAGSLGAIELFDICKKTLISEPTDSNKISSLKEIIDSLGRTHRILEGYAEEQNTDLKLDTRRTS